MADSGIEIGVARPSIDVRRANRMRGGAIASSALHVSVVLLLVVGAPLLTWSPPRVAQVVPINLVLLGEQTAAPASPSVAPAPQQDAPVVSTSKPVAVVPVAQTPPPQTAQHPAAQSSAAEPAAVVRLERKPRDPRPAPGPKRDALSVAKSPQPPSPADDLSARLKQFAQLRQPEPSAPRVASGVSNLTATSVAAATAHDASYGVKDFIRAQVERHWNPNRNTPIRDDWVVAIHIVLTLDGSVSLAEIVDNPRYSGDRAYRDFALSARNAVFMASPLSLPPHGYAIAKGIVLDFHARQVSQ